MLSLILDNPVKAATLYAIGATSGLSSYSEAMTVAMENAEDVCPEGNETLSKSNPLHSREFSAEPGRVLPEENFSAKVNIPVTAKLYTLNRATRLALSFFAK